MNADEYIVLALIITNLAAGFGCAIPIARGLRKVTGKTEKLFRYFAMFVGIYFVECVAFPAGMCTQVLTVALGFVWAVIFGLWLRNIAPAKEILKTAFFVSLYGCLPTCSFAVILVTIWVISGNSLLNIEQASKFGIPQFVPWPFNTLLGFCVGLATGTILLKTAITTGTVSILIRRGQNPAVANHLDMKLFLAKYLKFVHALYLCIGTTITPLFAQWCDGNLKQKSFLLCIAITFVYAAFFSILIHFIIKNLFWKLLVTVLAYVFSCAVLFLIFEFSPFILALPGIITLSITMQLFDNIKDTFPQITKEQIGRWLEVTLTLFTIFISSIMVGFVISWMNLYGAVLKGEIERKIVLSGMNSNLIITIYFWLGASLIFLSGVKHLWDVEYRDRKRQV